MKVEDLEVYNRLVEVTIKIHDVTKKFPPFELYELGSQLRRSSNSAPANLAEGFGNKHTNIFTETISRALGEIRETKHHLMIANRKGYLQESITQELISELNICGKMLFRLSSALNQRRRQ